MKRFLTAFGFFLLLIAAWHWAYTRRIWSPVLLPSPESVGRYLLEIAFDGSLWSSMAVTLSRIAAWVSRAIWLPVEMRRTPMAASSATAMDLSGPTARALTGFVTAARTCASSARPGGTGR